MICKWTEEAQRFVLRYLESVLKSVPARILGLWNRLENQSMFGSIAIRGIEERIYEETGCRYLPTEEDGHDRQHILKEIW